VGADPRGQPPRGGVKKTSAITLTRDNAQQTYKTGAEGAEGVGTGGGLTKKTGNLEKRLWLGMKRLSEREKAGFKKKKAQKRRGNEDRTVGKSGRGRARRAGRAAKTVKKKP